MIMPLDDIRVIDLTSNVSGPFCTRMLADCGAEVIKVEDPPGGDPARLAPPLFHDQPELEKSGLFLFLNTSKRGVALNLKRARGRAILEELVRTAHVLVEDFKPGFMASWGLGYDALHRLNPRLVVTSITNFGQSGPYQDWEGTDLTVYAMGGNMCAAGDAELPPMRLAGQIASFQLGYAAALATMTALLAAEDRGEGDHVDVNWFEVCLQSIDGRLGRLLGYQHTKTLVRRRSWGGSLILGTGNYPCADGWIQINSGPVMFPRLAKMIGAEHLLALPEWSTAEARSRPEAVDDFEAILVPWLLERKKQEILALATRLGVLAAPVNTISDVMRDEHLQYRNYFQTIDHPATGPLAYPGYAVRFHADGTWPPRRAAPLLGQHTAEVLESLGYAPEEIVRLHVDGVV
ncbi:MAG: CoA transferase [Chloroflexi bacterium]|nr:CoA transferase [Chloroflexota bacterium]